MESLVIEASSGLDTFAVTVFGKREKYSKKFKVVVCSKFEIRCSLIDTGIQA